MITQQQLMALVGKSIGQICPNNFANPHDNHCAHFVAHTLGYSFGFTCRMMSSGSQPGGNIKVQEIFGHCPTVGNWASRPATLTTCLAFITNVSNVDVTSRKMTNVPRKHVGIFLNGMIWHYSNRQHQVVQETPEQFSHHYAAPDNAMFFGSLVP